MATEKFTVASLTYILNVKSTSLHFPLQVCPIAT